jgi:hypothetical protein
MSLILDGTNGLSDVDGSAATPAIRGSDANTGVFFGADQVGIATNGVERVEFGNSETVFNDGGADVDFRVESDTDANALFVQGSDGNVGIGVVPTAVSGFGANKLLEMGGASAPALIFRPSGSTSEHTVLGAGDGLVIGATGAATASNNAIRFFTSNTNSSNTPTERVRIDSIGTSNFFANNPIFAATSAGANSTSANAIFIGYHSATSTTALGTSSIVITSNGNIFNTNGSYGSLSDAKLKENVVDATPKLDKLNQVRVVSYNLKGELGHETHKQLGVIAQELEQIFPGMVEESPDRDAEGNDLGTVTKSVKYSVFVPMLIKAIQEQQAIITALTARVEALEGAQA